MEDSISTVEVIAAAGLALTALGAFIAATGVIVSREAAMTIGVARYVPENPEDQLKLPAVKSILSQSKRASVGLFLVMGGTLAQLLPFAVRVWTVVG